MIASAAASISSRVASTSAKRSVARRRSSGRSEDRSPARLLREGDLEEVGPACSALPGRSRSLAEAMTQTVEAGPLSEGAE